MTSPKFPLFSLLPTDLPGWATLDKALAVAWQLLPPDERDVIKQHWQAGPPAVELVARLDGDLYAVVDGSGRSIRFSADKCAAMPVYVLVGVAVHELAFVYLVARGVQAGASPQARFGWRAIEAEEAVLGLLSEWEAHFHVEFVDDWIAARASGYDRLST
ncbi:MAG TPA: hypothetical protein VH120_18265 [Gemmataceae bacterium]|jgi:hypothetical protein|nr:hypothetical protein [Gemmataceae bacterium]